MSDTERLLARDRLVETLGLMIAGTLSFIEGSRIVNRLADTAGFDRLSKPFVAFVAIVSETDAVPVGSVRDLWHPKAVAKHDDDWAKAEVWAKQHGEPACREALTLLGQASAKR